MLGYSKKLNEVFILKRGNLYKPIGPKISLDSYLLCLNEVSSLQWHQVNQLQVRRNVIYLRLRYGSPRTYVLLAYYENDLVHIEWIVPAYKIQKRYHFVTANSYSIISCLTSRKFRGQQIYPSQIQKVVTSKIHAEVFWIWTTLTNTPSLKGIYKAGAIKVGELVQKKWFWGLLSHVDYYKVD